MYLCKIINFGVKYKIINPAYSLAYSFFSFYLL